MTGAGADVFTLWIQKTFRDTSTSSRQIDTGVFPILSDARTPGKGVRRAGKSPGPAANQRGPELTGTAVAGVDVALAVRHAGSGPAPLAATP
jgi:hypothetical protein